MPAAGRMNGESTAALKQAETENGLQITGNDVILKDMESILVGIWKKNPLEEYDNQLGKIQQEKLQLKQRMEELENLEKNTLEDRKDVGLRMYMRAEKRERLLSEAEELGFSHELIEELRKKTKDWNQDNITNEIIDEFENLKFYIEKQAPYRKNPLYFLGGITNIVGGNENDD